MDEEKNVELIKQEIELEKQRTKTEKAKNNNIKTVLKFVLSIIAMLIGVGVVTWVIAMFMPENVNSAINIVKNLFS